MQDIVSRLNGDAFSVEKKQLIKGHELGLKFGSTPITCKYNDLDTSTKNPVSHGFYVLSYVI